MYFWYRMLPIIIYCLLIAILIVALIFSIKSLKMLKRCDNILKDIDTKLQALTPIFEGIENFGNKIEKVFFKMYWIKESIKNKLSFLKKEGK